MNVELFFKTHYALFKENMISYILSRTQTGRFRDVTLKLIRFRIG